jgi:hypothetical protein
MAAAEAFEAEEEFFDFGDAAADDQPDEGGFPLKELSREDHDVFFSEEQLAEILHVVDFIGLESLEVHDDGGVHSSGRRAAAAVVLSLEAFLESLLVDPHHLDAFGQSGVVVLVIEDARQG